MKPHFLKLAAALSLSALSVRAAASPTALSVSSIKLGGPISNNAFGANNGGGAVKLDPAAPYPVLRWGGNAATRYNYVHDVSARASDWFFLTEANGGNSSEKWLDSLAAIGASGLLTISTIGFTACGGGVWGPGCKAKTPSFSVAKYGAQAETECTHNSPSWCDPDAGNGVRANGSSVVGNDVYDTTVPATDANYALSWLDYLAARPSWPALRGVMLDNEPVLWSSTHRDVHPNATTYDELWSTFVTWGSAVRGKYPHLEVHGPQSWGWCAYFSTNVGGGCVDSPDREAHGGVPLTLWLLQQVVAHHAATGVLLLTHLDVHAYPQATGVDGSGEDDATAALRLRSTMMWANASYVDESWIKEPVNLIPRLHGWLNESGAAALGVKLAVSEFSFGDSSLVTTALATAETLSLFAREGVDSAQIWTTPAPGAVTAAAYSLFLSYDGAGAAVAGSPVDARSDNNLDASAYAFADDEAKVLRVAVFGKTPPSAGATASATLAVAWPAGTPLGTARAQAYGFSHSSTGLARLPDVSLPCGDGAAPAALALPAWSATLLVIDVSAAGCVR